MEAKDTKEVFEQMAAHYDTKERAGVAEIIAEEIRRCVPNGKERAALDYGCGTGLVGLRLLEDFRSILFVDVSPQMIRQVDQKLAQIQNCGAKTLCCDFCRQLPPLRVDTVFMAQVLLHIKDTQLILQRMAALLREGGQLVIVDFDKDDGIVSDKVHNGFVQTELASLVQQAGFSRVQSHTFYRGEKLFMNRDASLFLLSAEK